MKKTSMLLIFLFTCTRIYSQNENEGAMLLTKGIKTIDHAVKHWNKSEMDEAKAILAKAVDAAPKDYRSLYWNAYADYQLAIYFLYVDESTRDEDAGKRHVENAIKSLEKAISLHKTDADSYALLGSLTGMKIQFSPISGMWLGPKSNGLFQKAVSANDKNPRVFYLMGIGTMNTPSMFGGGTDKAISQFEKALSLFEKESMETPVDSLSPRWGLEGCYSFLGNAYEKNNEIERARICYQKALELNPNSSRAKMELVKLKFK
ncbi:tetratricopeptide repeat protein [bacterium]|nr:MAG: tetratricopeptide repeat protein [bacterium]